MYAIRKKYNHDSGSYVYQDYLRMLDLFPSEPLTIIQGSYGSCFFLSYMYALCRTEAGRKLLKKPFMLGNSKYEDSELGADLITNKEKELKFIVPIRPEYELNDEQIKDITSTAVGRVPYKFRRDAENKIYIFGVTSEKWNDLLEIKKATSGEHVGTCSNYPGIIIAEHVLAFFVKTQKPEYLPSVVETCASNFNSLTCDYGGTQATFAAKLHGLHSHLSGCDEKLLRGIMSVNMQYMEIPITVGLPYYTSPNNERDGWHSFVLSNYIDHYENTFVFNIINPHDTSCFIEKISFAQREIIDKLVPSNALNSNALDKLVLNGSDRIMVYQISTGSLLGCIFKKFENKCSVCSGDKLSFHVFFANSEQRSLYEKSANSSFTKKDADAFFTSPFMKALSILKEIASSAEGTEEYRRVFSISGEGTQGISKKQGIYDASRFSQFIVHALSLALKKQNIEYLNKDGDFPFQLRGRACMDNLGVFDVLVMVTREAGWQKIINLGKDKNAMLSSKKEFETMALCSIKRGKDQLIGEALPLLKDCTSIADALAKAKSIDYRDETNNNSSNTSTSTNTQNKMQVIKDNATSLRSNNTSANGINAPSNLPKSPANTVTELPQTSWEEERINHIASTLNNYNEASWIYKVILMLCCGEDKFKRFAIEALQSLKTKFPDVKNGDRPNAKDLEPRERLGIFLLDLDERAVLSFAEFINLWKTPKIPCSNEFVFTHITKEKGTEKENTNSSYADATNEVIDGFMGFFDDIYKHCSVKINKEDLSQLDLIIKTNRNTDIIINDPKDYVTIGNNTRNVISARAFLTDLSGSSTKLQNHNSLVTSAINSDSLSPSLSNQVSNTKPTTIHTFFSQQKNSTEPSNNPGSLIFENPSVN